MLQVAQKFSAGVLMFVLVVALLASVSNSHAGHMSEVLAEYDGPHSEQMLDASHTTIGGEHSDPEPDQETSNHANESCTVHFCMSVLPSAFQIKQIIETSKLATITYSAIAPFTINQNLRRPPKV